MDRERIKKDLKNIIGEVLETDEVNYNNETRLEDIGIDSIGLMSMFVYIEELYQFDIEEEVIFGGQFEKVIDIEKYIIEKINGVCL